MGTEMSSATIQNTEARRARSFASCFSSVNSVPLCFQSFRAKIAEVFHRRGLHLRFGLLVGFREGRVFGGISRMGYGDD